MVSRTFNKYGEQLVKDKKVSLTEIDNAVRNVLRAKFRLGLFEHPFADAAREKQVVFSPENVAFARTAASNSLVLLKNENGTLPISRSTKKIAVIGALANDKRNMIGNWTGDGRPEDAVTLLEGVQAKMGGSGTVTYARGCEIRCEDANGFDEAVRLARDSDFVILAVGEDVDMSGEASSRSDIGLPGKQLDLVKAIHSAGKPYAVVLMNGRPLTINWAAENSPAILETWFAGTQAGNGIADVLFGDVNPSGKLPVTFPRSVGQIPIYYNALPTGRPFEQENKYTSKYLDLPNPPLYPFGFGLSYTTFRLSNLHLGSNSIPATGELHISVDVENTGGREGTEVVQVYVHDLVASMSRPLKELKGFERITLKPGEKRSVQIEIRGQELGFYDAMDHYVVEPGKFDLMVGTSSDAGLHASFSIVGK